MESSQEDNIGRMGWGETTIIYLMLSFLYVEVYFFQKIQ